jgi:hypothetical protein
MHCMMLVCAWPHSVFRQNHLYVKTLLSVIPLFISVLEVSVLFTSQKILVPCQPSGRRVIPFGRSSIYYSIRPDVVPYRPDDVHFRPDLHCIKKLLFQLASARTSQQPVQTPFSDRSASDSFQVQNRGRLIQPSRRCGFPSGPTHP